MTSSTFWGLRLEPGKRYSTTVDKTFHVSMAALDCSTVKNEKDVHCIMLEEGESNIPFILCNLQKPKVLQQRLSLNFESGDRITFFCRGSGAVHLTGYIIPEDDDFAQFGDSEEVEEEEEEEADEEEEEEDEDVLDKVGKLNGVLPGKRKGTAAGGLPAKKKKIIEQESGDSDDDEDEEDEVDEDESGDSDEEIESDEESEVEVPVEEKKPVEQQISKKKKKKNKQGQNQQSPSPGQQQQQQPKQKQQNAALNGAQQGQQKKKQSPQQQQTGNEKSGAKKVLEGGVGIQELKIGNGPVCKPGKMVTVYYTGRFKSSNKIFDQTSQGPGFKFRVGRGEVIKGWDVGLAGMKVGGKRLITCPPNMAYGQKGNPPTIPGNSSLVFEVELKNVH